MQDDSKQQDHSCVQRNSGRIKGLETYYTGEYYGNRISAGKNGIGT